MQKGRGGGEAGRLPHRRGVGPSMGAAEARWREDKYQRDGQPQNYRELLQMLRREVGEAERALVGSEEVCVWLDRMHVVNRYGGPVTPSVVGEWRRRLGLPMMRGRCAWPGRHKASRVWTTNLALTAWLCSLYRSGGPCLPNVRSSNPSPASRYLRRRRPAWPRHAGARRPARRPGGMEPRP